jgi:putative lipoprotein
MGLLLMLVAIAQPPLSARPDSLDKTQKPINVESVSLHREPDRWFAMDKFWHFSASFVTVGAAYHLGANRIELPSPWPTSLALGGTLTLGVSKELCDLAGPSKHFSWKDLVADAAGVGAGYFAFIHRF